MRQIINELINNKEFPLLKFKKNKSEYEEQIFNKFININKTQLLKELIDQNLITKDIINILKFYFKEINFISDNITLEQFLDINDILDKNSKVYFYKKFLDRLDNIPDDIINEFKKSNLIYKDYLLKTKNPNIKEIYKIDKFSIFKVLNNSNNKYELLKEINDPEFIINNMNGNLVLDKDTFKYINEVAEIDVNSLLFLKNKLDKKDFFEIIINSKNKNKLIYLIESPSELKIVLSLNLDFITIEHILTHLKTRFPNTFEKLKL